MPNSVELAKHETEVGPAIREDSEYVSLVTSDLTKRSEVGVLHSQAEVRSKSFNWWIKALILFITSVAFVLILFKWGVPFVFEKVCPFSPLKFCACVSSFFWHKERGNQEIK